MAPRSAHVGLREREQSPATPSLKPPARHPHPHEHAPDLPRPGPSLSQRDGSRLSGPERDRMRVAVLDEASIVCSTLSFAGSAMFYRMTRKFDVVVIDEVGWLVCVRVCVWGGSRPQQTPQQARRRLVGPK